METVGKSIYRCKETHQGDRCKLVRGHQDAAADSDTFQGHVGNFTMWGEAGVTAKAIGAEITHKRNRRLNRALKNFDPVTVPAERRKLAIAELDGLVKFFRKSA